MSALTDSDRVEQVARIVEELDQLQARVKELEGIPIPADLDAKGRAIGEAGQDSSRHFRIGA